MTLNIVFSISPDILSRVDNLMATLADFTAKLDSIDAKTADVNTKISEVAAEIVALKDKIAAGGMSVDEEAQVVDRLTSHEGALEAAKAALDASK